LCQKVKSPTSAKTSRLRSHAHCGVQSLTSCPEAFHDGAEILQGAGLLHMMEKNLLGGFSLQKKQRDGGSKKEKQQQQQKMKQQ